MINNEFIVLSYLGEIKKPSKVAIITNIFTFVAFLQHFSALASNCSTIYSLPKALREPSALLFNSHAKAFFSMLYFV